MRKPGWKVRLMGRDESGWAHHREGSHVSAPSAPKWNRARLDTTPSDFNAGDLPAPHLRGSSPDRFALTIDMD